MNWLDKLERKFGRFYIKNLILYIVALSGFVYILGYMGGGAININNLALNPELVKSGQVWRVITFVFIPPLTSPLWAFFALYFNYLAGRGLEDEWGGFKFNFYYFFGVIATIIVSFITGVPATGRYINLSLFLAFARIYPDFEMLLFFVLPIKVKYLAWFNWLLIGYEVITAPTIGEKFLVLATVINFIIFFGREIIKGGVHGTKAYGRKRKFDMVNSVSDKPRHKCVVCGITEREDPDMQFRYCSKCNNNQCYCMDHISNHEHNAH